VEEGGFISCGISQFENALGVKQPPNLLAIADRVIDTAARSQ
jgi:hypothetical protein